MYSFSRKRYLLITCVLVTLILPSYVPAIDNAQGVFNTDMARIMSDDNLCRIVDFGRSQTQAIWLESLYGKGFPAPIWSDHARYDALLAALMDLKWDGLAPEAYAILQLQAWRSIKDADSEILACRDLLASSAYLAALDHLHNGFLDRSGLAALWRHTGNQTSGEENTFVDLGLVALQGLENVSEAIDRARPKSSTYRKLRAAYRNWYQQHGNVDWPVLPDGPLLRPGMQDIRVPILRQRLAVRTSSKDEQDIHLSYSNEHYDAELVETLKTFQERHRLKVDGVLGPETLAALNLSRSFREKQLWINLERMRWLERELSPTLLLVDIADARATLTRDDLLVWQGRVQVGSPRRQTPPLRSAITHLTFNPTWTVPPSIYQQDKLPAIRQDVEYLAKHRFRVLDRDGRELNPVTIDWNNPGPILLRQDPGPGNALGIVVVRFFNPFSVYLHDTPYQKLFDSHRRTFSSGCVRVEQARELADQLFADASQETRDAIRYSLENGLTRNIRLPVRVPILMDYWTASTDADGQVQFRPDVYQRDAELMAAMMAYRRSKNDGATLVK